MACALDSYACYGGVEIWNNCRTNTYLRDSMSHILSVPGVDSDCCQCCDTDTWVDPITDEAPWYDVSYPESADFYGFMPTEIVGLTTNPTTRSVTATLHGGSFGSRLDAFREIEITGLVFGGTCEAVIYGLGWLQSSLQQDCGSRGFSWQQCCTDQGESWEPDTWRMIPCVALTEGLEAEPWNPVATHGLVYEVTFTITASRPWIYNLPETIIEETLLPGDGIATVDYTALCVDGAAIEVLIDRKSNGATGDVTFRANPARGLPPLPYTLTNATSRYGVQGFPRAGDSLLIDPRCLGVYTLSPTLHARRPASNVQPVFGSLSPFAVAEYGQTWRIQVEVEDNSSGEVLAVVRAWPRRLF